MERTQIYLTDQETKVLDRLAIKRSTTRSHLIREAIEAQYMSRDERIARALAALEATFGMWKDREDIPSGEIYVERIRSRPGMQWHVPLGTPEDPL